MKGLGMEIEWTPIQFFISEEGVCEVQSGFRNSDHLRCTCPKYRQLTKCKHQRWVENALKANNGEYSLTIKADLSDEEVMESTESSEGFRQFMLKYSPIEVL